MQWDPLTQSMLTLSSYNILQYLAYCFKEELSILTCEIRNKWQTWLFGRVPGDERNCRATGDEELLDSSGRELYQ